MLVYFSHSSPQDDEYMGNPASVTTRRGEDRCNPLKIMGIECGKPGNREKSFWHRIGT